MTLIGNMHPGHSVPAASLVPLTIGLLKPKENVHDSCYSNPASTTYSYSGKSSEM